MRIRATVAAVSGALALSAFAVSAAHATDSAAYRADVAKVQEAAHAASGMTAFSTDAATDAAPYTMDVTFSNLKVGSAIKVGTTNHVAVPVTYTLTHGSDVDITASDFFSGPEIYKGSYDSPDNLLMGDNPATCTVTSSTTASCKGNIDIYPADGDLLNSDAGTWSAGALAVAYNGQDPNSSTFDLTKVGYAEQGGLGTTKVQRYSKLTVDATPEPVYKGKTLTAKGKLTRANWETNTYKGFTNQPVKLQFRKAGTSTYTTIKTVYSDSYGNVKATTTANYDGYWRFSFAGTTTTPAVSATGDYVDVK
ncbi:hypothetical protein HEP84_24040 [Streptomyces sp. RLB1-33]|uniref:hypothetical protein n=1 Tax=Streptomyces mirabilis TaxID=68239 RepID=UPI00143ECE86|nr:MULTISPECIES: hypothetical protein [Streptomyces]QIY71774.1 hypothetical protein HEP84_24040 [Streptomyces sp. RLB1-33]QUW81248.1 hypothetical protein SMIR_20790 [Streptomyces mirabilis]